MSKKSILIAGDTAAFVVLVVIGFATHAELSLAYLPRMAAAFLPTGLGWFLLAPWFELFDETVVSRAKTLLRIPLVFVFVAPFAVILRSVWLGEPVSALFTLVLAGSYGLGMIVWRWLYLLIDGRGKPI